MHPIRQAALRPPRLGTLYANPFFILLTLVLFLRGGNGAAGQKRQFFSSLKVYGFFDLNDDSRQSVWIYKTKDITAAQTSVSTE
jgi:hypothetical protein